jgi:protein MPE1
MNIDMSQMLVDSIPQLQAQIAQVSRMLQNPSIPNQLRQTTEAQYQNLQMQLQQAQTLSAFFQQTQQNPGATMGFGMYPQGSWTANQFSNQQPAGQDSAYQRLPINNRRRNLKRDRPSDFLEVGGENENKMPRYWE